MNMNLTSFTGRGCPCIESAQVNIHQSWGGPCASSGSIDAPLLGWEPSLTNAPGGARGGVNFKLYIEY